VLRASLYITACTTRNRVRRWARRLREPRYLLGFIAVVAYFYYGVFERMRVARTAGRRRRSGATAVFPVAGAAASGLAAMALLAAAAASWLIPGTGRLLEFSSAEVQFLFPAPVSRRQLIAHRLLRSQLGLLFASLVPSLAFSIPSGSAASGVRTVMAVWLLFVAARAYFSGVTLARANLFAADRRLRLLARLPLAAILITCVIVIRAVAAEFLGRPAASLADVFTRAATAANSGTPGILLRPFAALVAPLFATTWTEYAIAVGWSACVAAAGMVWVLASDEAFHDVSREVVERKRDQRRPELTAYRARKTDWTLAPTGRPEGAFIWKTVIQTLRVVDRRVIVRFTMVILLLAILVVSTSRGRGLPGALGSLAAVAAMYSVLLAPQVLRLDFRQDLQHLEIMKPWPVRSAAVVRGEIMGPAILLTLVTWALIALAVFLSAAAFSRSSADWRLSIGIGALVLAPALIFAQYTIHNAMALLFPAWVPLGSDRARGLEAMGQRLLTLGATWLGLVLMMLPGAVPAAILWFAFYRVAGPWVIVPASAAAALVIGLEILLTTEALGPAYERLDLMAIERPG
jgi:hypothetical protein